MDAFVFANVPEPPSIRKFGVALLSEQLAAPSPSNRTSHSTPLAQPDLMLLPSSALDASSSLTPPSFSSSSSSSSNSVLSSIIDTALPLPMKLDAPASKDMLGEAVADEDDNQEGGDRHVEAKSEANHQREGEESDDDNNNESKTPVPTLKGKLFDEPDSDREEHALARSVSFKMTSVGKRTQWMNPEDLADMLE